MSDEARPVIEMRGVKLKFKDRVILNGIDIIVREQETRVIMGVSGCGKSTLLGILLGLLTPNEGTVDFKGEDMTHLKRLGLVDVIGHGRGAYWFLGTKEQIKTLN